MTWTYSRPAIYVVYVIVSIILVPASARITWLADKMLTNYIRMGNKTNATAILIFTHCFLLLKFSLHSIFLSILIVFFRWFIQFLFYEYNFLYFLLFRFFCFHLFLFCLFNLNFFYIFDVRFTNCVYVWFIT